MILKMMQPKNSSQRPLEEFSLQPKLMALGVNIKSSQRPSLSVFVWGCVGRIYFHNGLRDVLTLNKTIASARPPGKMSKNSV